MNILNQFYDFIDYLNGSTTVLVLIIAGIQAIAYYIYSKVINYVNKKGNGDSSN